MGRTTNSASDRRHAEALSARRLAEGALCSTRFAPALALFDAARAASRGSIVAVAVGDDEQMEGGMGGANGEGDRVGATLFSASQHSACITFLRDSCELGRQAVEMRTGNEEADEGWQQLEEQLYRRWEILGICQSKAGNRKVRFGFGFEGSW